jgi:acyl-CoA thioester hydrolase
VTADILHELPMRWADLDSLNHVNNVVYVDYAAESRAMLVDDGLVGPDSAIAHVGVRFLRPLLLGQRPVGVTSSITDGELTQEISVQGDEEQTVFARVVTTYGPRVDAVLREPAGDPLPARVRRSDLDATGAVSTTKLFELFQEGRILLISTHLQAMRPGRFVVGSTDVNLVRPVGWRSAPYDMRARVSRVGGSSFTIAAELADGDQVLARSTTVLVGFDLATQRSRRLDDQERSELEALLA